MIRLETFDQADYDQLLAWIDSPETLMQFAGPAFSFPLNKQQLDHSLADTNRHAFKALTTETDTFIGYAEIYFSHNTAFLGRIIIGEQYRGKGYGKRLVYLLLEYSFRKLDYSRAELYVFDWNTSAINCYKSVGFRVNSKKSRERTVDNKVWTAINMELSKFTWEVYMLLNFHKFK